MKQMIEMKIEIEAKSNYKIMQNINHKHKEPWKITPT